MTAARKAWIVIVWMLTAISAIADDRPNFLMILLDDAGWTDVGCFGSQIDTPNIDRLAAEGMTFTDCHSAAPNCSPSRAGLLTGRIPPRAGIYSYLPPNHVMHLEDEEVTVAELLQQAGYHTGHFGKWHLSQLGTSQPQPADQGFDYSLGTDNNAAPSHRNPVNFIRNGQPIGQTSGYSCQIVVNETIDWLTQLNDRDNAHPFFACVWFHEPHNPIASPPELVQKYRRLYPKLSKKHATYYANIENADQAVGQLLQALDRLNETDDTVVFFTSDNGPLNDFSCDGLREKKSHVWEGGHRVPGIFRWPRHIGSGSACAVPISGIDYLPTVCEIAALPLPEGRVIDGTSIVPLLEGRAAEFDRPSPLYWFFYRLNPAIAVRDGKWSLIATTNDADRPKTHALIREDLKHIRQSHPTVFQLFDLSTDLGQQRDVASQHPRTLKRLATTAKRLHREVVREGVNWDIPASYGKGNKRKVWKSN